MTATTVNGLDVVRDEPTLSPITTALGNPVYWPQTRTLTLSDGSTVYGCVHCDYVSTNMLSIRPHLNKHKQAAGSPVPELSLSEALARLGSVQQIEADRDHWRSRALTAERTLRDLRKALGKVG